MHGTPPNYTLMSASAFTYNGHEVKEMNEEDMEHVTRLYVDAARLADVRVLTEFFSTTGTAG